MTTRDDDANIVTFDRDRKRGEASRRELFETARRLATERAQAEQRVTFLLRATARDEWPSLASSPELRNAGCVERIVDEVRRRMERDPREALALSNLAATIAETLPADSYPRVVLAQLRAQAWKERANTLRYLGRYDEAIAAVDRAEEMLEGFATAAHDRAIVQLVRAIIYFQMDRLDEALALLGDCKVVFRDHGDTTRYLSCGLMEGNVLYERGEYATAELLFKSLLGAAEANEDVESEARLHNNLGYCATHLGRLTIANVHFGEAAAHFRDLGLDAEAARTERGAGLLFIEKGAVDAGVGYLEEARRSFATYGMTEEAGLCGLEIAETLLARGEHAQAAQIAAEIVESFLSAKLEHRMVEAVEQLRAALDADAASLESVRAVHASIEAYRAAHASQATM